MTHRPTTRHDLRPGGILKRLLQVLVLLAVLVIGFVFGVYATVRVATTEAQQVIHEPEQLPDLLTPLIDRKLDLDNRQRQEVHAIIQKHVDNYYRVRAPLLFITNGLLNGIDADMRNVLTDEQYAEWDAMYSKLREQWVPRADDGPTD